MKICRSIVTVGRNIRMKKDMIGISNAVDSIKIQIQINFSILKNGKVTMA